MADDDPREAVRTRFAEAEDLGAAPPTPAAEVDLEAAAALPCNDVGNARRMVLYYGRDLMFVPRVGWFDWTGRVWQSDPDSLAVRRRGQTLAELIEREVPHVALDAWQRELLDSIPKLKRRLSELEAVESPDLATREDFERVERRLSEALKQKTALAGLRSGHRAFAKTTGNSDRIRKAILETETHLAVDLDALDAEPLAVNVGNGTLRFTVTRGEGFSAVAEVRLDPHARETRASKIIEAPYDPASPAPLFEAFLERIQPAPDMRRFLQRWFGLSLTGLTGDQKLCFLYGHGANGKSVLVDLVAGILGSYAATAKIESLTGQTRRGGGDATPDLIPLMGARFVRASEPEQGEKLREGTIKELTGGEPIMVRALHSDFVEVKPRFKLTISGNHKPEIRGTDDGIWRRVLLVPFDIQIPPAERDPDLGEKLAREAPGILRWMVEGLLEYLEIGLAEPARVLEATQEYRADSDPVGTFLCDCTLVTGAEADFMLARDLIEAFNVWNLRREGNEWGGRTISLRLKAKVDHWRHPGTGMTFSTAKRQATGYRGIRLTDTFAREVEEARRSDGRRPRRDDGDGEEVPL